MRSRHLITSLCLLIVCGHGRAQELSACEPEFLEKCIKMGKEFFDRPENIFPLNSTDIDRVCSDVFPKMWSDFVGCTKSFGASCISSTELSQFNRAVGNSINSVHKMCTNADYQKDYLKSAICIKSAAIEETGCKIFYDELLQEINSPSESSTLCCAHTAFKDCLMEETKACSCQGDSCQATNFARSIVENAIGFILNRCSKSTAINSVCQKFTPTVVEPPRPTSHSVEAGSYFPSPVQSIVEPRTPGPKPPGPSPSTSAAPPPPPPEPKILNSRANDRSTDKSQRMPKQDLDAISRAYPDDENEDDSINFDEFFDLAVYKNQFLNSQATSFKVMSSQVLLMTLTTILVAIY